MIEYGANSRTQVIANAHYLSMKYLREIEQNLLSEYSGDPEKWSETFDKMGPSIQIVAAIRLTPVLNYYKEELYALMRDDCIELFDVVFDSVESRIKDIANLALFDEGLSYYDDLPKLTFDTDRERDLVILVWGLSVIRNKLLKNVDGPIINGVCPIFVKKYSTHIDFDNTWFVSQDEDDKLSICVDSTWCAAAILLDDVISESNKELIRNNSLELFSYSMGLPIHPAVSGEEPEAEFLYRIGLGVFRLIDDE